MDSKKDKQLLIASILVDMGMADEVISAVTDLSCAEFQQFKK